MILDVNGIELNYIKEGEGNPIILLHGNGEDLNIFEPLKNKLKQNYTVYAIDSRNHGSSSVTNDFTYETMCEDVFRFITKLELTKVSIVGFSDGAIIALLLALKHKNTLDKIALLGVNLKPTDFKKQEYNFVQNMYKKTNDPFFKMMLEHPNIELEDLQNIKEPTLLVAAQKDVFYRKLYTNILATIPNAELKIMKGHDHGSYIINNDILYPDLIKFLQ